MREEMGQLENKVADFRTTCICNYFKYKCIKHSVKKYSPNG